MPRTTRKQGSEPDPQRLEEEYRAIQTSLEEYLDSKLALLPKAERRDAVARTGGFRWQRADTYFLITLALLIFLAWQLAVRTSPAAPVHPAAAAGVPGEDWKPAGDELGDLPAATPSAENASPEEPPAEGSGDGEETTTAPAETGEAPSP